MRDLEQILTRGTRGRGDLENSHEPTTAVVVQSDRTGVHVAAVGGDRRNPVGPCFGAGPLRDDGTRHPARGATVLLVWTTEGPWIAGVDPAPDPAPGGGS